MKFIEKVTIEGFRSIKGPSPIEFDDYTTLVGKNSSGKSNALRALNLFFNGYSESGRAVEFDRDLYSEGSARESRKKKFMRVEVVFHLSPTFKYPSPIAATCTQLGQSFKIARIWELDRQYRVIDRIETNGNNDQSLNDSARHFLNLITYRYIPNRTVPSILLKDESRALAKSIQIRLKGNTSAADLIESLRKASEGILKDASRSFKSAGAPISGPQVAAPSDLGDLLTISGFQAASFSGKSIQDEDWGAGHQAFFLYQLLYALDTHYSRFFGWKQATIWGIEEPESGLHHDLETQLASKISGWSHDSRSKMQVIQTTHSPVFAMAAKSGYWVENIQGVTTFTRESIPQIVRAAEIKGVSGWTQPVLAFPSSPIVLVEGKYDAQVLCHIAELDGASTVRFMPLPELDPAEKGSGKDSIISYLRKHAGLIHNRPASCPIVVVLDWEVSNDQLNEARTAYGDKGGSRVIRMDANYCNTRMSKSFTGIERFYPPEVIEEAVAADRLAAAVKPNRPISIAKDELNKAKKILADTVVLIMEKDQLPELLRVWGDIKAAIGLST